MLNNLVLIRSRRRGASAAFVLAALMMAGCGSHDEAATPTQRASTTAATTSADPAPAAASSTAPASSKATADTCPVNAKEVSQQLGLKVRRIAPFLTTPVSCAFGPVTDCPCGATKYSEVNIAVAIGFAQSVADQRATAGGSRRGSPVIDRPDLGKHAFVVRAPAQRGRWAVFPTSAGPAVVNLNLGSQNDASRAYAAHDARVSNRVISFAAQRIR